MGNQRSITTTSIPEKPRVPDSIRPNYQPPVRSHPNVTYPPTTEKNPVEIDRRNRNSRIQSKSKVSKESLPPHPYQKQPSAYQSKQPTFIAPVQPSFPIENKERLISSPPKQESSSVPIHKSSSFVVTNQQISPSPPPQNTSLPFTFTASNFERAPMIQLNYVVRSSNNQSIHTYEPNNVTVMHRTSTQAVPQGNRWYDNDYNQNTRPRVKKYF